MGKAKQLSQAAVKFFAEQVDWDKSDRQKLRDTNVATKWFAGVGWFIATLSTASVIPLLNFQQTVPVTVIVDRNTGEREIVVGRQALNMFKPENESVMMGDAGRYVRARECFTRGEASFNYSYVWWNTTKTMRGDWDNFYLPEKNPNAWLARLGPKDSIECKNMSYTFLPNEGDTARTMQVRYDVEKHVGSGAPTIQSKVATLTFRYLAENIPKKADDIVFNPSGFETLTYRTDKMSEERPLVARGAQR